MHEIFLKCAWDLPEIILKIVWGLCEICLEMCLEICVRFGCNLPEMPENCLRFAWDLPEICLRYAWDMPDICLRFTRDLPEISLRYACYMPEICLRYLRFAPLPVKWFWDPTWWVSRLCRGMVGATMCNVHVWSLINGTGHLVQTMTLDIQDLILCTLTSRN